MGAFQNYPYADVHQLNLDWIIKNMKEVLIKTGNLDQLISEAQGYAESAQESAETAENVLNQFKNLFVTPQMFGALGDGTTDDTQAFKDTIADGRPIIIPYGSYVITEPLTIPDGTTMRGLGSDTVLQRVTSTISYTDFLLVGALCDIGDFNIDIKQGTSAPTFEGSFIKINEVTLSQWVTPTAGVKTYIHDIYAYCYAPLPATNQVSGIQLSLEGTYQGRSGFCDVKVHRYGVGCTSGSMIGYYCHAYSNNSNYWITGIEFVDCFVANCRWGLFPVHSDQAMFDPAYHSAQFNAICLGVQMQAQTGTKGFAYLPSGSEKVSMSFNGCKPWDFQSFSSAPWYFDYARIANRDNLASSWLETSENTMYYHFLGVDSDMSTVTFNASNMGWIMNYVCKNALINTLPQLAPKLLAIPNATRATRLISMTASNGRRITIFKYYDASDASFWGTMCVYWTVGNNVPVLVTDVGTAGVRLGYKITQSGSNYTLDLYMYKSTGMNYIVIETLPFDNSQLAYDNVGYLQNELRTPDFYKYPLSEVHFSAVPDDITEITGYCKTNEIILSGTNASDQDRLFRLTIVQGNIVLTPRNYYDFT